MMSKDDEEVVVPDDPVVDESYFLVEKRGLGFTTTEDLIVCKAVIATSEDGIVSHAQKKIFINYNLMISNKVA